MNMAKPHYKRSVRVADLIRIEVADILARKVKDPRVEFVTVTDVELSADLRIARIYVTSLKDHQGEQQAQAGLKKASSYIRAELGRRVTLRYTPELIFCWDQSEQRINRIEQLFNQLEHGVLPNRSGRSLEDKV